MQSFLDIPETDWITFNDLTFAIRDGFPVTNGHRLVITRRVVASWFDATPAERAALLDLVDQVRRRLDETHRPDGYNVGVSVGAAAGQTVPHLHVHVIPRHRGDMPDPRGDVRHVIPWKGNYWRAPARPLATGTAADPFLSARGRRRGSVGEEHRDDRHLRDEVLRCEPQPASLRLVRCRTQDLRRSGAGEG